jgi:hypothetical protein
MLKLLTLWFGISVPLVFIGAYFGYKQVRWTSPAQHMIHEPSNRPINPMRTSRLTV